ncbi:hypothetical protein HDK77DRAFT_485324 [Phyllosticta capitalensis]|uniref:Uncharacterized protein n=1 Tax=Phyllosticta capitalensis TaxID=121624 RepID=A0ABR1YA22_9PEZI
MPLDDQRRMSVLRDLDILGRVHTWSFEKLSYADATTHHRNWQGLPHSPFTHGSHTDISDEYIKILRQQGFVELAPGRINMPSSPPTKASYLRTSFHFAKTLVHELCHAFNWATIDYNPTSPHPEVSIKVEPFFMDQVRCEVGRAWESFVFGGYIDGIGDGLHMQYGMFVAKWPNCHTDEGEERAPSRRAFRSQYAIPMAFIQDLWTWQFWTRVDMHGGGECWPNKSHGGKLLGLRKPTTTIFDEDTEWAEFFSDTSSIASDYQHLILFDTSTLPVPTKNTFNMRFTPIIAAGFGALAAAQNTTAVSSISSSIASDASSISSAISSALSSASANASSILSSATKDQSSVSSELSSLSSVQATATGADRSSISSQIASITASETSKLASASDAARSATSAAATQTGAANGIVPAVGGILGAGVLALGLL